MQKYQLANVEQSVINWLQCQLNQISWGNCWTVTSPNAAYVWVMALKVSASEKYAVCKGIEALSIVCYSVYACM